MIHDPEFKTQIDQIPAELATQNFTQNIPVFVVAFKTLDECPPCVICIVYDKCRHINNVNCPPHFAAFCSSV